MARKSNKGQPGNEGIREEARQNQPQDAPQQQSAGGANTDRAIERPKGGNGGNSGTVFSSDEIAARAYQIFEREGRMDGRDMDHWLQAEQELRREREQRSGAMTPENAPRSARQLQR